MTQSRKRSRRIDVRRMRKAPPQSSMQAMALKPLALAVAASSLAGCGPSTQEARIYASAEDCIDEQPGYAAQCRAAYQNALEQSRQEGARYSRKEQCEADYGEGNCEQRGSYFRPLMAGFMFSSLYHRAYSPLYYSTAPSSRYYGKWSTVGGDTYPKRAGNNKVVVSKKTLSRGGFGSTTAAKSKWGGSRGSSSSGWGG